MKKRRSSKRPQSKEKKCSQVYKTCTNRKCNSQDKIWYLAQQEEDKKILEKINEAFAGVTE